MRMTQWKPHNRYKRHRSIQETGTEEQLQVVFNQHFESLWPKIRHSASPRRPLVPDQRGDPDRSGSSPGRYALAELNAYQLCDAYTWAARRGAQTTLADVAVETTVGGGE